MTEDQLTLIATRIMDRVERDGNGLQLTALIEELRAGLAIVQAQPVKPEVKTGSYNEFLPSAKYYSDGEEIYFYNDGKWLKLMTG